MYKLVILFFQPRDWAAFDQGWQKFLGLVEQMPGLQKEVVADVEHSVYAPRNAGYKKIHELYFESREALEAALASEAGQLAGRWLHAFTEGKFASLTARHMQATAGQFKRGREDTPESP